MAVDLHYCQNKIQDVKFFGEAQSCMPDMAAANKEMNTSFCEADVDNPLSIGKEPCCRDHSVVIDGMDTEISISQTVHFENINFQFLLSFIYSFVDQGIDIANVNFLHHYTPPLPDIDYQVSFQVFLI
ncbi:hypothetical protein GCM10025777_55070 [Membranihabitans marinus]